MCFLSISQPEASPSELLHGIQSSIVYASTMSFTDFNADGFKKRKIPYTIGPTEYCKALAKPLLCLCHISSTIKLSETKIMASY